MTINARALGILVQNDTQVQQTVRLFQGVTPIRDITPSYPPGPDQATAKANLESVVKSIIQRAAADSTLVPCAPGTILDLTDPAPTPPTQAQIDQAAYFTAKRKYYVLLDLKAHNRTGVTQQQVDDALVAWNALRFDPAWEEVA